MYREPVEASEMDEMKAWLLPFRSEKQKTRYHHLKMVGNRLLYMCAHQFHHTLPPWLSLLSPSSSFSLIDSLASHNSGCFFIMSSLASHDFRCGFDRKKFKFSYSHRFLSLFASMSLELKVIHYRYVGVKLSI